LKHERSFATADRTAYPDGKRAFGEVARVNERPLVEMAGSVRVRVLMVVVVMTRVMPGSGVKVTK
jgi:hypothetical protein